jgi:hypothetical protein
MQIEEEEEFLKACNIYSSGVLYVECSFLSVATKIKINKKKV